MNKYLAHYQAAVQHPAVSGFEVLDMLMVRDKLLAQVGALSAGEQAQLVAADQHLLAHTAEFCAELAQITDLEYERQQRKPTRVQWWWYLDVLLQVREYPTKLPESVLTPA